MLQVVVLSETAQADNLPYHQNLTMLLRPEDCFQPATHLYPGLDVKSVDRLAWSALARLVVWRRPAPSYLDSRIFGVAGQIEAMLIP